MGIRVGVQAQYTDGDGTHNDTQTSLVIPSARSTLIGAATICEILSTLRRLMKPQTINIDEKWYNNPMS